MTSTAPIVIIAFISLLTPRGENIERDLHTTRIWHFHLESPMSLLSQLDDEVIFMMMVAIGCQWLERQPTSVFSTLTANEGRNLL